MGTCGTPDYFGPEMVAGVGHTVAIDWWTLGVLLYELIAGDTPFSSDDTITTFRRVKRGIDYVHFPFDGPEVSLVKGLCKTEPSERMAMRRGGIKNVQDHDWYRKANFSWEKLFDRTMLAPYIPNVKSPKDLSNFDNTGDEGPPEPPYSDPNDGWDAEFEERFGPSFPDLVK